MELKILFALCLMIPIATALTGFNYDNPNLPHLNPSDIATTSSSGGTTITGGDCPAGYVMQNITTTGVPQCTPDQTGGAGGSYNATYDKWSYNQTYLGSTYNETYATWLPNYTLYKPFWYNMTGAQYQFLNNNFNGSGNFITTNNITSDWLFAKLNWSDVQNAPAFTTGETDPQVNNVMTDKWCKGTGGGYVDCTEDTPLAGENVVGYSGGITMPSVSGQSGKLLSNDGTDLTWSSAVGDYAYNQTQPFTDWLNTFAYNYNQTSSLDWIYTSGFFGTDQNDDLNTTGSPTFYGLDITNAGSNAVSITNDGTGLTIDVSQVSNYDVSINAGQEDSSVSATFGVFGVVKGVSGDPEAWGMLNITQARFLEVARATIPPAYKGAMWDYYDANTKLKTYFIPEECRFYKQAVNLTTGDLYFAPTKKITDGRLCYNTNYKTTYSWDSISNKSESVQIPKMPYPHSEVNKTTGVLMDK